MDLHELEKKTVNDLRDMAAKYEDIKGVSGLKKDQLLEILCEKRCAELEMPCLRLAGAFAAHSRENPGDSIYRGRAVGGHLSATGHKVAEEEIASFLSRNGLLEERADLD